MALFDSFYISASGMTANRFWADLIANNVANMNSTGKPGDPNNLPYCRQVPVFAEILQQKVNVTPVPHGQGVQVTRLVRDNSEPQLVYDPGHPDANPETGYVAYPNINLLNEMVNLMAASRAYESNATVFEAAKSMAVSALEMGR
ncbi:flagellar basal body rod protein FlgC [Desulfoscipio gibsoniae]|uniref:Flagellar basal-body rod protein FlgC n=1 Tax=Desulfoscipio gibsoniae DSM 7213 TaxID=767817 RepID=R4KPT1_9FIRM|nr:flagellar basal body rod protein FlgC [Desulfoscipio gibsoniae]AGL01661.1 flagellar basal-body rod protein FlgC [Desulfoscipio gibsoniae DSM 7213]